MKVFSRPTYSLQNLFCLALILSLCPFLFSCAAASIASTAFIANKALIEPHTGGNAEIVFNEEGQSDNPVNVKNLALFPGYRIEAKLATSIAAQNWVNVITPYQIEKIDPKASFVVSSPNITQDEKLNEYQRIGQIAEADAILEYREGDMDFRGNYISFKRTESTTNFTVRIISVSSKEEIWKRSGQVVVKHGGHSPGQEEIDKLLVDSITQKLDGLFDQNLALK